jgi:hypothetical protein
LTTGRTAAVDFILPVYVGDYRYFERILSAAVDEADGDHTVRIYKLDQSTPQSRLFRALHSGKSEYNILFSGHAKNREEGFQQVDFPLTRGLLGLRVLAILKQNQHHLQNINTFDDLKSKVTLGSGTSWPDTHILEQAGLRVKKASTENLWTMLVRQRFLAFPRSVIEIEAEMNRYASRFRNVPIVIDQSILLSYRYDHFFYLKQSDTLRRDILLQGLLRLHNNGKFQKLLATDPFIRNALRTFESTSAKIFHIENPLNTRRINDIPDEYWQVVRSYKQ